MAHAPWPVRHSISQRLKAGKPRGVPGRIRDAQAEPARQVRFRTCQWISGERGSWVFCDLPAAGRTAYCPDHAAICLESLKDPLTLSPAEDDLL